MCTCVCVCVCAHTQTSTYQKPILHGGVGCTERVAMKIHIRARVRHCLSVYHSLALLFFSLISHPSCGRSLTKLERGQRGEPDQFLAHSADYLLRDLSLSLSQLKRPRVWITPSHELIAQYTPEIRRFSFTGNLRYLCRNYTGRVRARASSERFLCAGARLHWIYSRWLDPSEG